MHRDIENSYVKDMIEKTTRNTVDDCIVFINMLGCLVIMWVLITTLS